MTFRPLMLLMCLAFAGDAQADMYKRVEPDGSVTYSNTPIKGAKKIELEPLPTMGPYKPGSDAQSRVKPSTQKNRDEARRKILEDELAAEEKLLAEARQKLQEAQDNPHTVVKHGPEGDTIFPNVAAQQEEIKAAQDEVSLHQKNIEALKTELGQGQPK